MVALDCGFKPDSGNPTVRDYRGALENTATEEIGTHSTIERVDVDHSLPKASVRPVSIPINMSDDDIRRTRKVDRKNSPST